MVRKKSTPEQSAPRPERVCERVFPDGLAQVVARQADTTYLVAGLHAESPGDGTLRTDSNEEAWERFRSREFYDTRRVRLERFHLFEWFPLVPGKFHTREGREHRERSRELASVVIGDQVCLSPHGKLQMLLGGVGCIRLRPRAVGEEARQHYFMTASATAVCHEGFPVLVPRDLFGKLMPRLLREGAVPATIGGEMRYMAEQAVPLFQGVREIPLLYLHVDRIDLHRSARQAVTTYDVSVVASFEGTFQEQRGMYVTYDTFDPADGDGPRKAAGWIKTAYAGKEYGGIVVTDFDEVEPQFPEARFALPLLLSGRTDIPRTVQQVLGGGYSAAPAFVDRYQQVYVNTQGGTFIHVVQNVGTVEFGAQVTGIATRTETEPL